MLLLRYTRQAVGLAALAAAGAASVAAPIAAQRASTQQDSARPTVVLISIDGLRPDYVLEADRHGLRIPNLRRLVERGSYATGVRGVVPTVTYPSHTTLLTGVAPARHGIHGNTTFDPLSRNQGGWYWYATDITARTLWDAAADAGLVTASVHWPVSVGARVTHNLPQYWRTGTADDRKLLRALSTPGLYDEMERALGPFADGIDESMSADESRARFAVKLLELKRPRFMTTYFTALDHEQHDTGPFSPSSFTVLERIDAIVGALAEAAERVSPGNAVICVVSDHGFVRTNRSVNLLGAFREAGLLHFAGDTAEKPSGWRATAWASGASAAVIIHDTASAATRSVVRNLLTRLAADTASGIDRVLNADDLRQLGGFPEAAFLVSLKPGYIFGARTRGPLVVPVKTGGMHGYLPDLPDMRSAFFISGRSIPARRSLGEIDMRDVAPTLAALLGLSLPAAEGQNVLQGLAANSNAR
ncbi:MAG: alkaline phosphatase family protein [Anaerolineae bacterium]|nr:alkaline phosphatase family protein [Gemmatimonadaceae bacterium]